jgi:hypothetical protein
MPNGKHTTQGSTDRVRWRKAPSGLSLLDARHNLLPWTIRHGRSGNLVRNTAHARNTSKSAFYTCIWTSKLECGEMGVRRDGSAMRVRRE